MKGKRANTVDPEETAHYEPSHLGLQRFANSATMVVFGALWVMNCKILALTGIEWTDVHLARML